MSLALGLQAQLGGQSQVQRAFNILRPFGTQSNLRISSLTSSTATSTGPVTIADGGGVEVLPNKTWRIT
jgi:hypothetical protein